jgi:hypothetical protein
MPQCPCLAIAAVKKKLQIQFFATKDDLLPLLEGVEKEAEINYVQAGWSDTAAANCYSTGAVLPNLGTASAESAVNCTTYLICPQGELIRARPISGQSYAFDQLLNPNTVAFTPGGLWDRDILLYGRFSSVSDGAFSSELLKLLGSLVRKRFKKIKAFFVGNEAERMLDAGKRLAIAVQSPKTLDLSRA